MHIYERVQKTAKALVLPGLGTCHSPLEGYYMGKQLQFWRHGRLRIAIIGSGVSGLACARWLCPRHSITIFEADRRLGGHVNTVEVHDDDVVLHIDTGFIVFNRRNYPNFTKLLDDLSVESMPTSMSFSVRCERTGTEYASHSANGLFAQRRNIVRPSYLRLLNDIVRFNREGTADSESIDDATTVAEYLTCGRYSPQFSALYLLPMASAIWSCSQKNVEQFPIRFILEFYRNHGLLSLRDRPEWRVIKGGSKVYIDKLAEPISDRIRLDSAVQSVRRYDQHVEVMLAHGAENFDEVVFACHSDQALRLLPDADSLEQECLSAFPYTSNSAVLHTDATLLPRRRRAWACWNYLVPEQPDQQPRVTYNMNLLQRIHARRTYCVTLNDNASINPANVIGRFDYSHPMFTTNRRKVQSRHGELLRRRRTSFCGAYWRNGFHEDGVVSAMAVCRAFGINDWRLQRQRPFTRADCSDVALPTSVATNLSQRLAVRGGGEL